MAYNFSQFKAKQKEIEEWFARELAAIRTGRATPAILDSVYVEQYGSRMQISHVAAIALGDSRSLVISPWDKVMLKEIESSISAANLGVSTSSDGSNIRVVFPELSGERRTMLGKVLKEKLEEARVRVRKERDVIKNDITAKEKAKEIGEDDKFRDIEALQKHVDEANAKLESMAGKKEGDIAE
ncbi:MAG: ribosome recycling factor [Patescibacteria group bacterium]